MRLDRLDHQKPKSIRGPLDYWLEGKIVEYS